ncbi:hypothetical protein NP493_359g04002 [Ridgeia piscesae]|uniref:guanylate cyclase n=1 Tax=Ridgeia piscesae TaxID=27915 RepID=A0AAD9NTI7_RIDPI|nr:hypothetical protein NP493_359g04002 [Ridgeia piscesae]
MTYLHGSPIISHGRLSTANVVVDNHWVCKVTDYGLPMFRSGDNRTLTRKDIESEMSVKFLYMAPEILQMTDALAIGTREGDVYSFGIMMNEIALIAGPFSIELAESTVDDIISQIIDKEDEPFRPSLGNCQIAKFWVELMQQCWDETPHNRPTFSTICNTLTDNCGHWQNETADEKSLRMLEEHSVYLETAMKEKMNEKTKLMQENERLTRKTAKVFKHLPR